MLPFNLLSFSSVSICDKLCWVIKEIPLKEIPFRISTNNQTSLHTMSAFVKNLTRLSIINNVITYFYYKN